MISLRAFQSDDLVQLVALNNAEVPHVSGLDDTSAASLVDMATEVVVADDNGAVSGFLVLFTPGADYASPNYQWFCDRYDDFVYVDRIVVAPDSKSQGIGRTLYEAAAGLARARNGIVTCEVNIVPPNEHSVRFHDRLGFVEVGQQDTGAKRVSLLEWKVSAAT